MTHVLHNFYSEEAWIQLNLIFFQQLHIIIRYEISMHLIVYAQQTKICEQIKYIYSLLFHTQFK